MKKTLLMASAAVLIWTSCSEEDALNNSRQGLSSISAVIEQDSGKSRVQVNDNNGGATLSWVADDSFNTFGDTNATYVFNAEKSEFEVKGTAPSTINYAAYPSSFNPTLNGTTLTMTLPTGITNVETQSNVPMWAGVPVGTHLSFKHLAAVLKIDLTGISEYSTIEVTADKVLAGDFTATLGENCVLAPAVNNSADDNKKVTITLADQNDAEVIYLPVPATTYATLSVTAKSETETKLLKSWTNLTFQRAMMYTASLVNLSTPSGVTSALGDLSETPVVLNLAGDFTTNESDSKITIPNVEDSDLTLNFESTPTTSEENPLIIESEDETNVGEATKELTINIPVEENKETYLTINTPTTTATIAGGDYATLTATTATNTLIIKSNVKIANLIIEGGNVVIEEGATITTTQNKGSGTITYNEIVNSAEELNSAVADANNSIVTLGANITMSEKLVINRNLVLDGNDYTLTYTGDDRAIDMPSVTENNTILNVTIQNLTVECSATYCNRAINYNANGKLILDNVTVTGTPTTYALNFPGKSDKAQVDITNCQITGLIALNVWGEDMIINVTNSILTSVDKTEVENYAAVKLNNDGITSAEGTNITIKGGKIVAKDEKGDPSAAVSNLTATGVVTIDATTEVTGFVSKPVAVIYYEGYNEFYSETDLQAAIDRVIADNNGKIRLISDVTLESPLTIAQGGNVTIDLNGYTISQEKAQTTTYAMITNKGTLTIMDTSSEGNGKISYKDITEYTADINYASNTIRNEGTLTLESGTIENTSSDDVMNFGYPHAIDVYQGSTTNINGGTVKSVNYDCIRMFCNSTTLPTIVNISGGNIINRVTFQNPTNNKAGYGELNITGGTFTTTDNVNANVRLLNFSSDVSNMKAKISGGTFDKGVKTQNYGSWTANWEWLTIENNVINKIE